MKEEKVKKIKLLEMVSTFLMFVCVLVLVCLQVGSSYLQEHIADQQQQCLFSRVYWAGVSIGSLSVKNQQSPLLIVDLVNLPPNHQFELVLLESTLTQDSNYFVYNPTNAHDRNCYYLQNY